jgi:hypothetical protein
VTPGRSVTSIVWSHTPLTTSMVQSHAPLHAMWAHNLKVICHHHAVDGLITSWRQLVTKWVENPRLIYLRSGPKSRQSAQHILPSTFPLSIIAQHMLIPNQYRPRIFRDPVYSQTVQLSEPGSDVRKLGSAAMLKFPSPCNKFDYGRPHTIWICNVDKYQWSDRP